MISENQPSTDVKNSGVEGLRVLILAGKHRGEEGVCLGPGHAAGKWAVSPDSGNEVLYLEFEADFQWLIDGNSAAWSD